MAKNICKADMSSFIYREISLLMRKRTSLRSYRKSDNLYSPIDLVVCEGETEIDHFCEFARNLRIHAHICKADGTDPKSIVNTAKRKSKEDGVLPIAQYVRTVNYKHNSWYF